MLGNILNGVVSSLPMLQLDYGTDFISAKLQLKEDKRAEDAVIPLDGTVTTQGWSMKAGTFQLKWDLNVIEFVMHRAEGYLRLSSSGPIYSNAIFSPTTIIPFGGWLSHTRALIDKLVAGEVVGVPVQVTKSNFAFQTLLTFKLTKAGRDALSVWRDQLLEQGRL